MPAARRGRRARRTKETDIQVRFALDGSGKAAVDTGLPFLDHMLELVAVHGLFDVERAGAEFCQKISRWRRRAGLRQSR